MGKNFSDCSVEELQELIASAKSGSIDLREFWAVGDTRDIPVPYELQHELNDAYISVSIKHIGECGINQSIEFECSFCANNRCIAKGNDYLKSVFDQVIQSEFNTSPISCTVQPVEDDTDSTAWTGRTTWTDHSAYAPVDENLLKVVRYHGSSLH